MAAAKTKKIKTSFFSVKISNSMISPIFNIGESVYFSGKVHVISKVIYDFDLNSFVYCFKNQGLEMIPQSRITSLNYTKDD